MKKISLNIWPILAIVFVIWRSCSAPVVATSGVSPVTGQPLDMAQIAVQIPNKEVVSTVGRLFKEVFGKDITPAESAYWKLRARTDKKTIDSLRGAMQYQKQKGVTMPKQIVKKVQGAMSSNELCSRTKPYNLSPEVKEAISVIKRGLLTTESWKSSLPLAKIENCLDIRFASTSESGQNNVMAVFQLSKSQPDDLRIIISKDYAQSGPVILGATLTHEITHAWQYVQSQERMQGNPKYESYQQPDCYTAEAQAYWAEISYLDTLSFVDKVDLREIAYGVSTFRPGVQNGAYDVLFLVDLAQKNWLAMQYDPVGFLSENYVKQHSGYQAQCGAVR